MKLVLDSGKTTLPEGFQRVFRIADLYEIKEVPELLILGNSDYGSVFSGELSFEEQIKQKSCFLNYLKSVPRVIYVRNKDSVIPELNTMVTAIGGGVEPHTAYLGSTVGIKRIERGTNYGAVSLQDNLKALSGIASSEDAITNPVQLDMVRDLASQVVESAERSQALYRKTSEDYNTYLSQMSETLSKNREDLDKTKMLMTKLQGFVTERLPSITNANPSLSQSGNAFQHFAKVTIERGTLSRSTYVIKDLGRTPYLTSFILGFAKYLEEKESRKVKVLFLEPVGEQYKKRYLEAGENWVFLQQDWRRNESKAKISPVVFTDYPMEELIKTVVQEALFNAIIVVDRTTSAEPKIAIDGVRTVYACASRGWYLSHCSRSHSPWFTAVTAEDSFQDAGEPNWMVPMFSIPTIRGYPKMGLKGQVDRDARMAVYASQEIEERLYSKLVGIQLRK